MAEPVEYRLAVDERVQLDFARAFSRLLLWRYGAGYALAVFAAIAVVLTPIDLANGYLPAAELFLVVFVVGFLLALRGMARSYARWLLPVGTLATSSFDDDSFTFATDSLVSRVKYGRARVWRQAGGYVGMSFASNVAFALLPPQLVPPDAVERIRARIS